VHEIGESDLWRRSHKEKCSLPKNLSTSSRTPVFVLRSG
jgi:hypothetical protein